jgi:dTDP-4-amino-4,6-dideoxygalactose transaminase
MKSPDFIPFNKPFNGGNTIELLSEVVKGGDFQGDGPFTKKCEAKISVISRIEHSLLTPSCTDALEMAYMLIDLRPGDEVIMPSYNFTSAAVAVVKLGATPVFVDIEPETLNISQEEVLRSMTKKTKAITFLNYAGYGAELDLVKSNISNSGIQIIEDNAHGFGGKFMNLNLGSIGDLSVQSFHSTKNFQCGEGGSISFRNEYFLSQAHILRQKGTNRYDFSKGVVSKYSWVGQGSSFLASELQAAVLSSQLELFQQIQSSRDKIWNTYFNGIDSKYLKLPPNDKKYYHTSHIFYLRLPTNSMRELFIEYMRNKHIQVTSHYQPLHNSIAGIRYGKFYGQLKNTVHVSETIVRLPLWIGMSKNVQDRIIEAVNNFKI